MAVFQSGATVTSQQLRVSNRFVIDDFVEGWWVLVITLLTVFPWAIVAVWDSIDDVYRTRREVARRLCASTFFLLIAYSTGMIFCVVLSLRIFQGKETGRYDEIATVAALLLFNMFHVLRNVLGWAQFGAIHKLRPAFSKLQLNFGNSFSGSTKGICIQGLGQLRVSERLFDNEWRRGTTPFLSPLFRYADRSQPVSPEDAEKWGIATWRSWWTQDVGVFRTGVPNLTPANIDVARTSRHVNVEGLTFSEPPKTSEPVSIKGTEIKDKYEWAEELTKYGWQEGQSEGQQDTHGSPVTPVGSAANASGVALLVHEKTTRVPNRMSALWYGTARFEEVYTTLVRDMARDPACQDILFPSWAGWLQIAQDIGTHLPRPVYLADTHLTNFAGELASASVILTKYPQQYRQLVEQVLEDGKNARWTFGWSGLLACFSTLWTFERVYIAMLNGLSLLALHTASDVKLIDANVRSMLYGYAAFEVSDRAVGKSIAEDRKAELLRRYKEDRGKTCRGSGLCATRAACGVLKLPQEASHMDGLPAFSTGWCNEYIERLPGCQPPRNGENHDAVEANEGSSNVWRYPHSHT